MASQCDDPFGVFAVLAAVFVLFDSAGTTRVGTLLGLGHGFLLRVEISEILALGTWMHAFDPGVSVIPNGGVTNLGILAGGEIRAQVSRQHLHLPGRNRRAVIWGVDSRRRLAEKRWRYGSTS